MPNYNHAHYLPEALEAVLTQSRPPDEVIVLDDGSTDESVSVIEEFARRDPRVRLVVGEANRGVLVAVNRLLSMTNADYVHCAAADDRLLPGHFEKSMALLEVHPDAGLCSTLSRVVDGRGADGGVLGTPVVADRPAYLPPPAVRRLLATYGNWLQGNTVIYRRAALRAEGGLAPDLGSLADSFLCQVLALRSGACFIPEPLAAWRVLGSSYSAGMFARRASREAMVDGAVALMRTRYRDLFPRGYADLYRRDLLFQGERVDARATRDVLEEAWRARCRALGPLAGVARAAGIGALGALWAARMVWLLVRYRPAQGVRRVLLRARRKPRAAGPGAATVQSVPAIGE